MPWEALYYFLKKHGTQKKTTDARGQLWVLDIGFTCGIGNRRTSENSFHGTGQPVLKATIWKMMDDPVLRYVPGLFSRYIKEMKEQKYIRQEAFGMSEERRNEYARKIPGNDELEGFRLNATTVDKLCDGHQDTQNCPINPDFASLSKDNLNFEGFRFRMAMVGFTRASCGGGLERKKNIGIPVGGLLEFWKSLPDYRKDGKIEAPTTVRSNAINQHGFEAYGRPCGMDPGLYLSASAHAMTLLIVELRLSYIETLSALRAWSYMAFRPYYFVAACHLILAKGENQPPVGGCEFGRYVLKLMIDVRNSVDPNKVPSYRYGGSGAFSNKTPLPGAEEWGLQCRQMTAVFLHCFKVDFDSLQTKDHQSVFESLEGQISGKMKNCGTLGTHHVIAFASVLGLLPFWMLSQVRMDEKGRPQSTIAADFKISQSKSSLQAIRLALQFEFNEVVFKTRETGLEVTLRFLENLECKYHRITTNNDKSYNDLQLREMFKIAIMFKNKIKVSFGDVEVTLDHPLFTTWNYGDRPRFIGEIVTNPSNHVLLSRFDWRNNQERLNFAKPTPQWTQRLDQKCLSRIPISKENTRIVVDAWKAFKQSSPRENISY